MSYEVECGECQEIILIEDLGVEVACPHCEAILLLSEDDVREEIPDSAEEKDSAEGNAQEESSSQTVTEDDQEDEPAPTPPSDSTPNFDFLHGSASESVIDDDGDEDTPAFSIDTGGGGSAVMTRAETETETQAEVSTEDDSDSEEGETDSGEYAKAETPESETEKKPSAQETKAAPSVTQRRKRGLDKEKLFNPLLSYAILVTLGMIYLMYAFQTAKPHQLESLPDIQPPEEGEFRHYRENASLAPGHSLKLGETQRFGSIELTPVKVTRAPLRFEHFQGGGRGDMPPTEPVLQLWLKIENVSSDQVFPPLDSTMVQMREYDRENIKRVYANNWVCTEDDLPTREGRILLYEHPPTSEYDIVGMEFDSLIPGKEMKTFLATQENGLGKLKGDLVWRFQIRKGFHPQTMNGVTTLVEVLFHSDEIEKG